MKFYICLFIIATGIYCSGNKSTDEPKEKKTVTTYTTIEVVGDYATNNYSVVTARKTVRDTLMSVNVKSSGNTEIFEKRWTKDSAYEVLEVFLVPDSTGKKAIKKADGQDSMIVRFTPLNTKIYKVSKDRNENFAWSPKWGKQ